MPRCIAWHGTIFHHHLVITPSRATMTILCGACRPIFCGNTPRLITAPDDGSYPPEPERQTHHVSPESLLAALELGCHICVRVYTKISGDSDVGKILAPRKTRLRAAQQEQGSRRCTTWALLQHREDDGDVLLTLVIVADELSFTGLACLSSTFVLLRPDGAWFCLLSLCIHQKQDRADQIFL